MTTAVSVLPSARELATGFLGGPGAYKRAAEFFTAEIRNPNTRRAYLNAARRFAGWCRERGLDLTAVETLHVATYIDSLGVDTGGREKKLTVPSIKQHLAGLRHLFDHLVSGGILKINPAAAVRGPRYSAREGKTPILTGTEPRQLLEAIHTGSLIGLRDRALVGVMLYTTARVSAVLNLKVEDYYPQGSTWFVRLDEKGGKLHIVPCNHQLQQYLDEYIAAAGIAGERKDRLFRSIPRGSKRVTKARLTQSNAYELIVRRARAAGIASKIGCHSMRGTAITNLLENGASVEEAQNLANHASIRTTKLYDRRDQKVRRDLVERIRF